MNSIGSKIALVAGIMFVSVLVLAVVVGLTSYISAANYAVEAENDLSAKWDNSQNVMAQYGQKVQEIALVPQQYAADVMRVVSAAVQGRYGKDGSKATWQMLKEQNPNLDPSMYVKIQQVIESGRDDFERSQKVVIDAKRVYKDQLGYVWRGFWLKMSGHPKFKCVVKGSESKEDCTDIDRAYPVITTDRAASVFNTGKESGPIQLFGNK